MLDPWRGRCCVVDLPQVFVSACWALRTTPENVVHGLTLLATGTFWTVCKSPPVHIFICFPHFSSCSVERDRVLPAKRCSIWQVFLVGWQGIVWWADVILDPFLQSGGRRLVWEEGFHRRKTAPGLETRFYLLVIVEWRGSLSCLYLSTFAIVSLRVLARAMLKSLCSVGSGVARNVPVIVLQALFSSGSTFPAWHDLLHTGAQYSAVE